MSASGDLYRCPTCGASLSLEQLRGTDCPFCKTVFPHHGRANEQAALVNQIMQQQIQQQYPYGGYGPPPQVPNAYGAPPPQMQNPYAAQQQQWQQSAQKSVQKMIIIAVVGVLIALFLAGGAVAFLFMAR